MIYSVESLVDYINWMYFYHAWGLTAQSSEKEEEEKRRLRSEADELLHKMAAQTKVQALVKLYPANSDGDDIVLYTHTHDHEKGLTTVQPFRLPLLRQQQPSADGCCYCLADYVCPQPTDGSSLGRDTVGVFATSVSSTYPCSNTYEELLLQTLNDRLAEASAERLPRYVRRTLWGYAPNEQLTMADLHAERFQGIRPAVGYPSLPDMSLNFLLDELLDFSQMGVRLTEHGMMQPHASVSGLMLSHPKAHYFSIGRISQQQLEDYARRRNIAVEKLRPYLAGNL